MKQQFIERNFAPKSLDLLKKIDSILGQYSGLGYDLSLRQLYYQLVARDFISNNLKSYKRIVGLVGDGRLAGLIPWDMIVDRNRETITPTTWESPSEIVRAAAEQFKIDKWENQPAYVEVMVEKDALSGVLAPVCRDLGVRFTANKGYSSLSMLYETGRRLRDQAIDDKDIVIFYLGDHDPSGIDMTRDIFDRLGMFAGITINVNRLALNFDQIEDLNPPENPAKETDSRYEAYVMQFGESCWELDAIEPVALGNMVRDAVTRVLDMDSWNGALKIESVMKKDLLRFAAMYGKDEQDAKDDQDDQEDDQDEED